MKMSNSKKQVNRSIVKDRVKVWIKKYTEVCVSHFGGKEGVSPGNDLLEVQLLDNARFKDAGKSKKQSLEKIWQLEWQWKDLDGYNSSKKWFRDKEPYSDAWRKHPYGGKFQTLSAAKNSIRTLVNYSQSFRGVLNTVDKVWRIRNIKTGEIYDYNNT